MIICDACSIGVLAVYISAVDGNLVISDADMHEL